MSSRVALSASDVWLLRLFVLIRAANGRISAADVLAELHRRKISGITAATVRGVLKSLVELGLTRQIENGADVFRTTGRGKKGALKARELLSGLLSHSRLNANRLQ